jgi:hypothetical protein
MGRDDLSGGDFERRKQCYGAMPLVIVALTSQGAAIGQLQPDILDVNIAQRLGQQRTGPAREPLRGRLSAASVSAYRWPSYRSAACQVAACLADLQGHGRHSDAAKG